LKLTVLPERLFFIFFFFLRMTVFGWERYDFIVVHQLDAAGPHYEIKEALHGHGSHKQEEEQHEGSCVILSFY
jgi:hypothetical protein